MHQGPHDPHGQWQHQPPYPPAHYQPRVRKSVEKQRGLGGCSHTVHLALTICTCGVWGIVWFVWWLIRIAIPKRKVTKHYY
ncbi:hypothetical protein GCM10027294_25560 [Marinactinospora endophytica]